MQLVGGFANSSVFFHDLADGVLCTETASVYVFADDRAYISKYAAAASEELRSVQVLLRRTALAHIHAAVERSSEIIITRATTFCFGCAKQMVLDL